MPTNIHRSLSLIFNAEGLVKRTNTNMIMAVSMHRVAETCVLEKPYELSCLTNKLMHPQRIPATIMDKEDLTFILQVL